VAVAVAVAWSLTPRRSTRAGGARQGKGKTRDVDGI